MRRTPSLRERAAVPLAAAAEAAGYRACFQCRPYRWPESLTWSGPELVCRAVRLILDGALDNATEEELGERLGVSPRHLRRLFTSHLGVTPDGLARSARAHFARRLLDDTDLSMLEIALATGFGSVRQFNRALPGDLPCARHCGFGPAGGRRTGSSPTAVSRCGWRSGAARLGRPRLLPRRGRFPESSGSPGGAYRRTIVVAGDPGVLELSPGGGDHLVLVTHLPHWEGLVHLVARARRIANLDLDLDEPAAHLAGDPGHGPLLSARPGLRPPGTWDPFEAGCESSSASR